MRLKKIVPEFLKPVLRPLYRSLLSRSSIPKFLAKITYNPKSPVELHQYWRQRSALSTAWVCSASAFWGS